MADAGGRTVPPVPKIIHAVWLQGLEAAPDLVRFNLRRWAALNPGYRINLLVRADVEPMLAQSGFPVATMTPQALADVVRLGLLAQQGGVWVDATVLPVRPLDRWLPEIMTESGFFAFARPGPDRPLSNWFLVSSAGNPIVTAWWQAAQAFWSRPRRLVMDIPDDPVASVAPDTARDSDTYPYFAHHYLFSYLLETRPDIAALWQACTVRSADLPHAIQMLYNRKRRPSWLRVLRKGAGIPVHKLNWRTRYPLFVLSLLR